MKWLRSSIKSLFNRLFRDENVYKIQTFTYFIPAPPARRTGYREKAFDKFFYEFINRGYEIIDIQTQSISGEKRSGFWFICTVRATNSEANELNLDDFSVGDFTDNTSSNKKATSQLEIEEDVIEGLYHID